MKKPRKSLLWLIAALIFWGSIFAIDIGKASSLLLFSAIIGAVVSAALLAFHIIRARLGY